MAQQQDLQHSKTFQTDAFQLCIDILRCLNNAKAAGAILPTGTLDVLMSLIKSGINVRKLSREMSKEEKNQVIQRELLNQATTAQQAPSSKVIASTTVISNNSTNHLKRKLRQSSVGTDVSEDEDEDVEMGGIEQPKVEQINKKLKSTEHSSPLSPSSKVNSGSSKRRLFLDSSVVKGVTPPEEQGVGRKNK